MAIKNVVTQHQRTGAACQELLTNQKRLRQAIGAGLHGVLQASPHWLPSPSSCSKRGVSCGVLMMRMSRMPGQHQRAEGVVNHGLVIHGQQLLADGQRGRVQAWCQSHQPG